jgi:hypothetical protein
MADLALLLQFCNYSDGLFYGYQGINPVQLPKVDYLRLQKTQAHLDLLRKILRSANRLPLVGALPCQPSLGGNHETFGEGRKGLTNQPLTDVRAVTIGGVDEIYSQFHCALQDTLCFFNIFGLTPNALASQSHRSKSKPIYFQIAANFESFCRCAHVLAKHGEEHPAILQKEVS